jgi:hypothetical protein
MPSAVRKIEARPSAQCSRVASSDQPTGGDTRTEGSKRRSGSGQHDRKGYGNSFSKCWGLYSYVLCSTAHQPTQGLEQKRHTETLRMLREQKSAYRNGRNQPCCAMHNSVLRADCRPSLHRAPMPAVRTYCRSPDAQRATRRRFFDAKQQVSFVWRMGLDLTKPA